MNKMKITIAAAAILTAMTAGASSAQNFSFDGGHGAGTALSALLAAPNEGAALPAASMPVITKSLIESQEQHLNAAAVDRKLADLANLIDEITNRQMTVLKQMRGVSDPNLRAVLEKQLAGLGEMLAATMKDYRKLDSMGHLGVTIPGQAQFDAMVAKLPGLNAQKTAIEKRMAELELASAEEKDPSAAAKLLKAYQVLTQELAQLRKQINEINSWR